MELGFPAFPKITEFYIGWEQKNNLFLLFTFRGWFFLEQTQYLTNIIEGTDPCSEGTDEAESSMILIKEFFELSDAEESFLERKASIRRSQHSREDSDQSKNLIEPTSSFVSETYITEPVKFEEDEELQHLESHLNNSISRILSKIRKIKKSSNKKRTTMSLSQ